MSHPFLFLGSRLLLAESESGLRLPAREEIEGALGSEALAGARLPEGGESTPEDLRTFSLSPDTELPEGFRAEGLRAAYHALEPDDFRKARRARHLVDWIESHRFCARCGIATERDPTHLSMTCPTCGQRHYPRVSPAVIVLVQRGEEVLLGRSPHFAPGVYSTLAGFVEPGESLEECVHREIGEEVGVRVSNIRYWNSQPHPFPHSLMIGFVADWADGNIQIDPQEIEDARWFHRRDLPVLPHPMSIAHALIQDFLARTESTS